MFCPLRWLPALLLTLLLAGVASDVRAGWSVQERAQLIAGGRVDAELIEALGRADEAPIVVAYRRGDPRLGPVRSRTAVVDGLVAGLQPGDLRIGHRFRIVDGASGRINRRGLLRLLENPDVARIGIDRKVEAQLDEATPLVELDQLRVSGWDGSGQVVAVIDTGVKYNHADLIGAVIGEACFCQGDDGPGGDGCCYNGLDTDSGPLSGRDNNGHGTRVGSIIASNGTEAPLGGAPGASLVSIKVVASNGAGHFSDLVAALEWIVDERLDVTVVNVSLGGGFYPGDCDDEALDVGMAATAIEQLWQRGVPTMAGSGNDKSGAGMIAPACISTAIAVGAVWDEDLGSQTWIGCTDPATEPDLVTCFGNSSPTTDIFAPGAVITASYIYGGAIDKAGTSYATPIVAACAAVLRQSVPGLTAPALETAIESSTVLVTDPKNGLSFPRLDCAQALAMYIPLTPALEAPARLATALLLLGVAIAALQHRVRRAR